MGRDPYYGPPEDSVLQRKVAEQAKIIEALNERVHRLEKELDKRNNPT